MSQISFPPHESDQVTLKNWRTSPHNHWAFHHVREIVPTAPIYNAPTLSTPLDALNSTIDLSSLERLKAPLDADAVVVTKSGKIVHEWYARGMSPRTPHILMSVSKSLTGLLAGALIAHNIMKEDDKVTKFIPEVDDTAFHGASIRDLLDMRVGIEFDEDYLATSGPIIDYRYAANWNPIPQGVNPYDLRSFMTTLRSGSRKHGGSFQYVSPCTDLLAWVCERASQIRFPDLFSEYIFKPMGAEFDGYVTVDRIGGSRAAGGICITARDLARIGILLLRKGHMNGHQILPDHWLHDIMHGGDQDAWVTGSFYDYFEEKNMHYRSFWYVHRGDYPLIHGFGIHGQYLFIDPLREISIAWFSSQPDPLNASKTNRLINAVNEFREGCASSL